MINQKKAQLQSAFTLEELQLIEDEKKEALKSRRF